MSPNTSLSCELVAARVAIAARTTLWRWVCTGSAVPCRRARTRPLVYSSRRRRWRVPGRAVCSRWQEGGSAHSGVAASRVRLPGVCRASQCCSGALVLAPRNFCRTSKHSAGTLAMIALCAHSRARALNCRRNFIPAGAECARTQSPKNAPFHIKCSPFSAQCHWTSTTTPTNEQAQLLPTTNRNDFTQRLVNISSCDQLNCDHSDKLIIHYY